MILPNDGPGSILWKGAKASLLALGIALKSGQYTRFVVAGSVGLLIWPMAAFWLFEAGRMAFITSLQTFAPEGFLTDITIFIVNFLFGCATWLAAYAPIVTYSFMILLLFVASLGLVRKRVKSARSSFLMLFEQILLFGAIYFMFALLSPPEWKLFGFDTLGPDIRLWGANPLRVLDVWFKCQLLAVMGWVLGAHPVLFINSPYLMPIQVMQFGLYVVLSTISLVHVSKWVGLKINERDSGTD